MTECPDSEESRSGGIQVVARSAAILRALGAHPDGLSLAAIAREVELPRSTVQRIVCALEAEFLVEPLGPGGGFRLGPAVGQLLYQTQTEIISVVRPHMAQLVASLNETVFLARLTGRGVTVIDRLIAEQVLRVVFPIGNNHPLNTTSAGKAVLMPLGEAEAAALLPRELVARTPASITGRRDFLDHLAQARAQGFATDMEEHVAGVSSYSVPLITYLGTFALGVVLPSARMALPDTATGQAMVAGLREAQRAIEQRIGTGRSQK